MTIVGCTKQPDVKIIERTLLEQRDAWNSGDIRSYMNAYWMSDSLVFIGGKDITYGWENTLNRYLKAYPGKEQMGQLSF
ncbi:MAG: hypothetical protein Kow0075_12660 [Salibacteraceae bacterium]